MDKTDDGISYRDFKKEFNNLYIKLTKLIKQIEPLLRHQEFKANFVLENKSLGIAIVELYFGFIKFQEFIFNSNL